MNNENLYIHLFNLLPKISYRKLCLIKRFFGSFKRGWSKSTAADFINIGFTPEELTTLMNLRKSIDLKNEEKKFRVGGIRLVGRNDDEYPFLLKQIAQPPWMLYARGASLNSELDDIAIVGTRIPSGYGVEYTEKISEMVVRGGKRIVSGLAFGVDSCAHKIAVKFNSPTVAVLASSVGSITPRSNTVLAERILETGGTIVSEYASASDSFKYRFRERNRIIAGMCRSTIVVEAGQQSGALITANHAFDQNRDVFALVGDIDKPQSAGCLRLITEKKASPITSLRSLSEDLGIEEKGHSFTEFADEAAVLLDLLSKSVWTQADDLARGSKYDPSTINAILTMLEMDGYVVGRNGQWRLTR